MTMTAGDFQKLNDKKEGMIVQYHINFKAYQHHFALPLSVIACLGECDATALKIILLIFGNPDKHYSTSLLATLLKLDLQTVDTALSYWVGKNVLQSDEITNQQPTAAKPTALMEASPTARHAASAEVPTAMKTFKTQVVQQADQTELSYLLTHMEQVLQRPVTSTDRKTMIYLFESYRIPIDVLLMAMQYAVQLGHRNIAYIEKICISWYDQGILSHDKAEAFLKQAGQLFQYQRKLQTQFGFADRKLIASEQNHLKQWFIEYQLPYELVAFAIERTVERTGKVAFAYAAKILQNWHQSGYTSVVQVQQGEKPHTVSQKQETSYDIELLDRFWNKVPSLD